jgi:hypothetical protein
MKLNRTTAMKVTKKSIEMSKVNPILNTERKFKTEFFDNFISGHFH